VFCPLFVPFVLAQKSVFKTVWQLKHGQEFIDTTHDLVAAFDVRAVLSVAASASNTAHLLSVPVRSDRDLNLASLGSASVEEVVRRVDAQEVRAESKSADEQVAAAADSGDAAPAAAAAASLSMLTFDGLDKIKQRTDRVRSCLHCLLSFFLATTPLFPSTPSPSPFALYVFVSPTQGEVVALFGISTADATVLAKANKYKPLVLRHMLHPPKGGFGPETIIDPPWENRRGQDPNRGHEVS
jgi:hypothetical protein